MRSRGQNCRLIAKLKGLPGAPDLKLSSVGLLKLFQISGRAQFFPDDPVGKGLQKRLDFRLNVLAEANPENLRQIHGH